MDKSLRLEKFETIPEDELMNLSGGALKVWYSAGPYTFYKDTRTGKVSQRQTISTADWVFGTMAEGWARSFHV